ncbi:hypothetical protein DIPPA_03385 [Diplonema papillatum]|nr:hypothetical protein DIPPA_03385 [Diplonema papillatum]
MARVLAMTLLAAAAAADVYVDRRYRAECGETRCGTRCCGAGWALDAPAAACVSAASGASCALCSGSSSGGGVSTPPSPCDFAAAPHPELLDEHDNAAMAAGVPRMGGGAVAPTVPNAGVTLGLYTHNGMDGWFDVPQARFSRFADYLTGLSATIPSYHTRGGFTVRYACRKAAFVGAPADMAGCDIFFFVYRCPPCRSVDNAVGVTLLSAASPAWYANSCGPVFQLDRDAGSAEHSFAAYSAELADGEAASVELDGPVELMFWAMAGKSVVCAERATEAACGAAAAPGCEWLAEDGVCRQRVCELPAVHVGPAHPRCGVCVDDESNLTPVVVGA